MTPHYNFWACKDDCEKKFTDKHCFGGGKYCAADTNHKTLSGKEIIMEDLREICELWKSMKTTEGSRKLATTLMFIQVHENQRTDKIQKAEDILRAIRKQ